MQNKFDEDWCLIAGGDCKFMLALRIFLLFVIDTLLNRTDKYSGASL